MEDRGVATSLSIVRHEVLRTTSKGVNLIRNSVFNYWSTKRKPAAELVLVTYLDANRL